MKRMKKVLIWAGGILAVLAVALAGCSETTVQQATTPADNTPAETTPTPQAAAQIGGTVTLKGITDGSEMQVTLLAVKDPARSTNQFLQPDPGNRYVAVRLRIRNTGTAVYDDSPSNGADVVDTEDQSYDASIFNPVEPALGSPTIRPGDQRVGWITFEVSEAAGLRTLQFALDSGFGPQTGEWELR